MLSRNLLPSSVSSSRYRPAADPTGSFFIYNLNVTFFVNNFFDFPQLGMDQDAVLFTANIFNGNTFHGADFFAVAKARLYNGLGFSVPVFTGLVGHSGTANRPRPKLLDVSDRGAAIGDHV